MSRKTLVLALWGMSIVIFPIQTALAQTAEGTTPPGQQSLDRAPGQALERPPGQPLEPGQTGEVGRATGPGDMAEASAESEKTVEEATAALEDIMESPEGKNMPAGVLSDAKAVIVVPSLVKAGFIAGGRYGTGVMASRQAQGWSPPIFVTLAGASVGAQIGVQSSDVLLVFNTEESVRKILEGDDLTLGVDASVTAGPIDAATEASTQDADVYAYKRTEGLFAGASLSGGKIGVDQEATMAYYDLDAQQARGYFGDESRMMQSILGEEQGSEEFTQSVPQSARKLQDALSQAME